jgi:DNA-binding NarL/FixJ family response regulator
MGQPESQTEPRPRVVIADDDAVVQRVVRDTLQDAGIVVAAGAANGVEAVELTVQYKPEVVLMDVAMPELDGISAMQKLLKKLPETKVVVLSASGDEELGLAAVLAGAWGFLNKTIDLSALPRVIRAVVAGEAAISRRLTARVLEELRAAPEIGPGLRPVKSPLTPREWEVFDLLTTGATSEQISDELVLALQTVQTHVKNILRKLGVHSRKEAVGFADQLRRSDARTLG